MRLSLWRLPRLAPALLVGSLILALATIANVCATLLFQPLFDNGVLGHDSAVLIPIVALQMALLIARGALAGVAFDLLARASARLGENLTLKIFDHLRRQSLSYFLGRPQADLLQLLRNDVTILEHGLGQFVGQAIVATFQTVAILVVMLVWQPLLALLCVAGFGASAAVIGLASRFTNRALTGEIDANAAIVEHLLATLGLRGFFLRVSASPDWGRTRMQDLLRRYRKALIRRRVPPNWMLASGEGLSGIIYFGFYLAGAYLVTGGGATTGSLVAMTAMVGYLIGSMNQLAPTYVGLGDAWLRLKRLERELAVDTAPPESAEAPAPDTLRGAFALDRATVRYGDAIALCEASLAIRPGRITAIIGRSGAGKTTLTLLLLRLIEPDSGKVTVDGVPINAYRRETLWRHIGYVPQEPVLFRGSARENIALGRPLAESEIFAAAAAAGIHERLCAGPEGYDGDVGENGYRLSAGERQRISFARALAGRPAALVLDEPTANLDAVTEALIQATLVDQRNAGRTIIIVTHNAATLAIADDVIVLDKGAVVCSGPLADPAVRGPAAEAMRERTPTGRAAALDEAAGAFRAATVDK
jgi:ABC-type multidrug transport system fused ATPase/permease subunit